MERIKSTINLLKTMLNTSYDSSTLIDKETNKINKKSAKVWLLGIMSFLILYLSYKIINELAKAGLAEIFLETFFIILQVLVLFQAILLSVSVIYFSEDIQNYLYLPISNIKLFITKFAAMMSIIFGTELTILLPSLYMYGARVILENVLSYYISMILVLFLISIFLASIVLIILVPIMRIFRFIKNKYWFQTIVVLVMTVLLITPMTSALLKEEVSDTTLVMETKGESIEEKAQIDAIREKIRNLNKYFIVGELGVETLTKSDINSLISILKLIGLNMVALTILITIGKFTYTKDVLWVISLFDKKKNKKINLEKRCKVRNKKVSFMIQDIKDILRNPTFFMHYVYNAFMIIVVIVILAIAIVPIFKQVIINNTEEIGDFSFDFASFSIIIGIIQLLFTISPISLTAISRYGKNAIFFKYIPIEQRIQFKLKNIPQVIRNVIIIIVVIATIHYLFPEIEFEYLLLMCIISMLLNIINSYILLLIDLKRPQLSSENEVSVLEQNDNKNFRYVVAVSVCVILWYLSETTKELSLMNSILIEIGVFSVILFVLEVIIAKKKERLFENIK